MERLTEKVFVVPEGQWKVLNDEEYKKYKYVVDRPKYADLYSRLGMIENLLCGDKREYSIDRLRELIEADRDGRVKILPKSTENTCGTCENFLRIENTKRGHCKLKPLVNSQYGMRYNIPFEPSQSRKACKKYESDLKAMKERK